MRIGSVYNATPTTPSQYRRAMREIFHGEQSYVPSEICILFDHIQKHLLHAVFDHPGHHSGNPTNLVLTHNTKHLPYTTYVLIARCPFANSQNKKQKTKKQKNKKTKNGFVGSRLSHLELLLTDGAQ